MVLVKRGPIIEADKGFPSQLRVMNFSEGSPYETLHAYVSNAMGPYFKSYIRETGKAERYLKTVMSEIVHCFKNNMWF